jgi:hypothetical protein
LELIGGLGRHVSRVAPTAREQAQVKGLTRPVSRARVVAVVGQAKEAGWAQLSRWHGHWGRDAAPGLGRRPGRLSLARLGALAGGWDDAAVGQAVSRFGKHLETDAKLGREVRRMELQLSNVGI